jgi:hemophore-related protein
MKKLLVSAVSFGALAIPLAGVASADPALDPIVNTTCSYEQVIAAVSAQNPLAGSMFSSSPQQQAGLRQFLASPPSERQRTAEAIRNAPENRPYLPIIQQAFNTCNNF